MCLGDDILPTRPRIGMLFWIFWGSEVTSHFSGTTVKDCSIFLKKWDRLSQQSSGERQEHSLNRSPVHHTHYSLTHSQFRVSSQAYVCVSGLWEESGDPGEGSSPPRSMRLQWSYCLKENIATHNSRIFSCLPDYDHALQLCTSIHTQITLCVWPRVAGNRLSCVCHSWH